jgi:hypothetical protein
LCRPHPSSVDFFERTIDADTVDLAIGGKATYQDRDVIFSSLAVDDIREQECLSVLFFDAASELPPHKRVHFRILVNRAVDPDKQSGGVERTDVVVQIRISPRRFAIRQVFWLRPRVHGQLAFGVLAVK